MDTKKRRRTVLGGGRRIIALTRRCSKNCSYDFPETSGSNFLIVSPSQTAARADTFMIAVLPQAGQRHRNVNGEAALELQSQRVSECFIATRFRCGFNCA
jgi:hypothetical protein